MITIYTNLFILIWLIVFVGLYWMGKKADDSMIHYLLIPYAFFLLFMLGIMVGENLSFNEKYIISTEDINDCQFILSQNENRILVIDVDGKVIYTTEDIEKIKQFDLIDKVVAYKMHNQIIPFFHYTKNRLDFNDEK